MFTKQRVECHINTRAFRAVAQGFYLKGALIQCFCQYFEHEAQILQKYCIDSPTRINVSDTHAPPVKNI